MFLSLLLSSASEPRPVCLLLTVAFLPPYGDLHLFTNSLNTHYVLGMVINSGETEKKGRVFLQGTHSGG